MLTPFLCRKNMNVFFSIIHAPFFSPPSLPPSTTPSLPPKQRRCWGRRGMWRRQTLRTLRGRGGHGRLEGLIGCTFFKCVSETKRYAYDRDNEREGERDYDRQRETKRYIYIEREREREPKRQGRRQCIDASCNLSLSPPRLGPTPICLLI